MRDMSKIYHSFDVFVAPISPKAKEPEQDNTIEMKESNTTPSPKLSTQTSETSTMPSIPQENQQSSPTPPQIGSQPDTQVSVSAADNQYLPTLSIHEIESDSESFL
jgi:hypothetical protein